MKFIKPTAKEIIDDSQKLMCSYSGCRKRWSVHIDGNKPMCSEHQWPKPDAAKANQFNAWAQDYVQNYDA